MPPEPFKYRLTDSPYGIKFSNYGGPVVSTDIENCIKQALEAIVAQMEQQPSFIDGPIPQNLILSSGTAQLHIYHEPLMLRMYVIGLLIAMFEWGSEYGYIDWDMKFLQFRGPHQRTLGFGSIVHNS